jgi:polyhydroxyalkanoate synthesis repressor PhaR
LIKRYGNRKLYDARLSRSVTLEEIEGFVRRGENVRVVDAETGEEITRRILVLILLEQKSARMLELIPVELLRSMIAMPNEPLTQWLAEYLAAGARWVEWQTGRAAAPPMGPSGLGGFPNWPVDNGTTEPPRPPNPPKRSKKRKAEPTAADVATANLRTDLDALWRRLGDLRRG